MKVPDDIRYGEKLLREAMELLQDVHDKFGMFERQYYWSLKKRFDAHEAMGEDLRNGLNSIDTEG